MMRHRQQHLWRYRCEAWQGVFAGVRALLWLLLPLLPVLTLALVPLMAVIAVCLWRPPGGMSGWMLLYCSGVAALVPLHRLCRRLAQLGGESRMPSGLVEIHRTQAPALFIQLDAVGHACNNVKIDGVFVSSQCNASMVRLERSGAHRHRRSIMTLGMPLLAMLSVQQLRLVMAHECGHLGGVRNRLSDIVGILDQVLSSAGDATTSQGYGRQLQRWVAWCGQLCRPLALPAHLRLSRSCEYRADRVAAKACSAIGAAQTLGRIALVDRTLNEYWWPSIMAVAGKQAQPSAGPFSSLASEGVACQEGQRAQSWLDDEWLSVHSDASTHPDFSSRLRMLGCGPDDAYVPADGEGSALAGLIPVALAGKIADALDHAWVASVGEAWSTEAATIGAQRRERDALQCRMSTQNLSAHDLHRLAVLLRALGDDTWRSVLDRALVVPSQAPLDALVMAAVDDLDHGALDAAGALIEQCRQSFPEARREYSWLRLRLARARQDTAAVVAELRRQAVQDAHQAHALQVESSSIEHDAHFVRFELDDAAVDTFQQQLQRVRAAARSVHVLKEVSTVRPEFWRWVVVVVPDAGWQEELLDRLCIVPSHQRQRCRALLGPLAPIEGKGCAATVQMPGSRIAGRIARGKAFDLAL